MEVDRIYMNNMRAEYAYDDHEEWNQFVAKSDKFFTIAQNPSLVKVLKNAFDWEGENILIYDGDKVIGVFNCMFISGKVVSMPHFSYGGFLINNDYAIDEVWEYYIKENNVDNYEIRMFEKVSEYYNSSKVMNYLRLNTSIDKQFMQFKSKLRSQIKKGYKNGLKIKLGNIELLNDFYGVYSKNMHSLGSPVIGKGFFESIFKYYDYGAAKVFCVYYNEIPVGASLVLEYLGFCEVCWASTIRKFNNLAPNMVLYWEMIKYSIENNMKIFSFGRGTKEGTSYRFKMQWGTETKQLYFNYSNEANYNIKSIKILPMIWARLPYPFVNVIGPYIAKKIY